ncbi:ankyrin repeat domain-containing protein [Shimia sp. R9_2]|uniref:ankyrin repeat domain-containing protein n=1 Tax=Shimia sp. R9_2 TaxID=2821112 RepID=UPI001AD9D17D|nr:ankyrin repeat domain-containing protein [Shimia sp. R9_2]MBO9398986.1 ankyrin repeat domain-containing protein [Shimia sp. R9_2]
MTHTVDHLRQQAKKLRHRFEMGDPEALQRVGRFIKPQEAPLKHADYLHVIANESGFDSWPKLKFAREQAAMDFAQKAARLEQALYHGQFWVIDALLSESPDLGHANLGLACALYDLESVRQHLSKDPEAAVRRINGRTPLLHLTFSKAFKRQNKAAEMLGIAEMLKDHGADLNDCYAYGGDNSSSLSALYGALGHADNIVLARWLLENGASPDDNESLYHATELGHLEGLRLMLAHGATIAGTNALARMLDFDNIEGVQLLLEAGADPNEGAQPHPSGEPSYAISALHHAARRRSSPEIARLLLRHGAEGRTLQFGHSAYALAMMYGNNAFAHVLAEAGQSTDMSASEALIAGAATEGSQGKVDAITLTNEQRRMLCRIVGFDDPLSHVMRLVGIGLDPNVREEMGMPAIQVAGWEGQAAVVEYLLTLSPDLTLKNNYGGDLLGTIMHGAGHCPKAPVRDHILCAELALEAGVPLHRGDIEHCADAEMRAWLQQWASAHADRVI